MDKFIKDRPVITISSFIPTCGRVNLSRQDVHDEFKQPPPKKLASMLLEIENALQNFRLLLSFAKPLSQEQSHPAFVRLWEVLSFYHFFFKEHALPTLRDRAEASAIKQACRDLAKELHDCRPQDARVGIKPKDLSCMTIGELALELAFQKSQTSYGALYKEWDQPFKTTSGIPLAAFVGAMPGQPTFTKLIVATSAESWTEIRSLKEWCQKSRTEALQQLDARLKELRGSAEGGLLERLRRHHEEYIKFREQGKPQKAGIPIFVKQQNLNTPIRWVQTHSPEAGYEYCAGVGVPFFFNTWKLKARCGSCQACRQWCVPEEVQVLEADPQNRKTNHTDSCVENSAILIFRCLENMGDEGQASKASV